MLADDDSVDRGGGLHTGRRVDDFADGHRAL
jgi:hypothetical protein